MRKAALSNLHTHEATGSSPVVSTKNYRNRSIPVILFRNPQLFEMLNFCRFIKTHTLTHTGKGAESTGQGQTGIFLSGPVFLPHLLADDPADGVGGILLHLRRGVGVGVQCETRRVVAQRAGQRFHVHPAFQRQRGEGVAKVWRKSWNRMCSAPMAFRILSWVRRKASGSYIFPVLGDGNRYWLRGCF